MQNRHARTPEELETLLLDGIVSAAPVEDEISAETKPPCAKHTDLINPVPLKHEAR